MRVFKKTLIFQLFNDLKNYKNVSLITLVNKDFIPREKMSVSGVFLDAEFKYVSRISLSPTSFAPG
jgi:hypothetical protein